MEELTGRSGRPGPRRHRLRHVARGQARSARACCAARSRARRCPRGTCCVSIEETRRSGWVVGTFGPHRNAAGEIVGVIGIIRNVTERRRSEQALRESEERFRLIADAAPVMIWMDDAEGMSTYFNKPWLDFTGRTLEQELGKGSRDGIHPDDLVPRFVEAYDAAFAARRPFQTEYRLRRADGEYRWVLETATPRFTPEGEFGGFVGTAIDITERRRVEQTLRKERSFLRQVIDINPNFVFAKDREGRFTLVNQAVADAYGTTVEGAHRQDGRRLQLRTPTRSRASGGPIWPSWTRSARW